VSERCWVVVPAAGVGRRMASAVPKQYLPLNGRPVIEHTLNVFLEHPRIDGVCVALSEDDGWWETIGCRNHPRLLRAPGGAERCHSVLHGLERLASQAEDRDWVLVHDAARPCLRREDLDLLLDELQDDPVGGLLGVPVHDTVKRVVAGNQVEATVPREGLWRAYTPQMFRFALLKKALSDALIEGALVTDDASAMELAGFRPRMVEGHADNIKITRPEDLPLAAFYLRIISGVGE